MSGASLWLLAAIFAVGSCFSAEKPSEGEALHADVLAKTEEYLSRLQDLLQLYEKNEVGAAKLLEQRSELFNRGLISRDLLNANRRARDEAKDKVDETRALIVSAQKLSSEVRLAIEMEKSPANEPPAQETVVFFAGTAPWALSETVKVESYFVSHFGISLPVSAVGQTELHTRMGFNHREAVDVALHPDSVEGQNLLQYLKSAGYPFIAFRNAVAGSATGAHIHIGRPSVRLTASARMDAVPSTKASF